MTSHEPLTNFRNGLINLKDLHIKQTEEYEELINIYKEICTKRIQQPIHLNKREPPAEQNNTENELKNEIRKLKIVNTNLTFENENLKHKLLDNNIQRKYENAEKSYKYQINSNQIYVELSSENNLLKTQIASLSQELKLQKEKWEGAQTKLHHTIEMLDSEKEQIIQTTKSAILSDKRNLMEIINRLQRQCAEERNIRSALQSRHKSHLTHFQNVCETALMQSRSEKIGVGQSITHLQCTMQSCQDTLQQALGTFNTSIGKLTLKFTQEKDDMNRQIYELQECKEKLSNDLRNKTQDYDKKKKLYCKIIIKLRNRLQKLEGFG